MTDLTAETLRAARALLNWSVADLAAASGVGQSTLNNAERKRTHLSAVNAEKVTRTFQHHGVEIFEGGVRFRSVVRRYQGAEGFWQFYNDIYETARTDGGSICLYNGVSDLVLKWLGEEHRQIQVDRMMECADNYTFRVIVESGDNTFFGAKYCQYKWFPSELFNTKTAYIYGSKFAIVTFEDNDVKVIVIDDKDVAETQRIFFDLAWNYIATEPQS